MLWEAARQFSKEQAYPDQEFPVVKSGARCVLCQQDINLDPEHAAVQRLSKFEEFVASAMENELREMKDSLNDLKQSYTNLKTTTESIDETLKEVSIEHELFADTVSSAIATIENRRNAVVLALNEDKDLPNDLPAIESVAHQADTLAEQIEKRIETLRIGASDETQKQMSTEALELRSRKRLGTHETLVLDEIERLKKIAAYEICLKDTVTNAITQKNSSVTKTMISDRLKKRFNSELNNLNFRNVEVELNEVGGADAVFYHKLVLKHAPGVALPMVVSEGEQRCLSIAAFFAELSTAEDFSAIVFDDPMSSFDYRWREVVARRLVEEAKIRQVIVFTHDIVFLLLLKQFAKDLGVEQFDQHIRQLSIGAGVCEEKLPWVAMPIKERIKDLREKWKSADKLFCDGSKDNYEDEAKKIYGYLREAWERAIEEVLLGNIIVRFRPSVQTMHIGMISDITEEDCRMIDVAMSKCSKLLRGHDQAAAARAAFPEPAEIIADIDALGSLVATIRKRREKSGN